jgi:methylenetetrahydrofolate dehydrogenase (NADP+)/methenyltetrahydrofolate cyclohydrolase
MKILDGAELAGYIKERQAKQVRNLRQSWRVIPKLAIIRTGESSVTASYLKMKQIYGDDILVEVDVNTVQDTELMSTIERLNKDDLVHGIIIQLPLSDPSQTEAAVHAVAQKKDVDGLGQGTLFVPATALAIDWLIAGYDVSLQGKAIAIVGNGRLVGAPLAKLWQNAGYTVTVYDDTTKDLEAVLPDADVIVTATGVPHLITSDMIKPEAVVVDAGTASENGTIVGDISEDIRDRSDLTITPRKGGVGPLTVAALFDNVIQSARRVADIQGQQDLN